MKKKQVQLDEKGFRKFSIRDSIAYAAGDFGCNMSFCLKRHHGDFLDTIHADGFHIVCSTACNSAGMGCNHDPLIGTIIDADRRQYKRNKFLTYIFVGSVGLIVGGALCFIRGEMHPI